MKTSSAVDQLRVHLSGTEPFEEWGIKFEDLEVHLHPNGVLTVELSWEGQDDKAREQSWKYKYASLAHYGFGGSFQIKEKSYDGICSASFEFSELSKKTWFEIEIGYPTNESSEYQDTPEEVEYEYLHFHNLKYGLIIYFVRRNWLDWKKAQKLH